MLGLSILLDGDNAWPDLKEKMEAGKLIHYAGNMAVAVLPGGMESGWPSVSFRFDLPDGTTLIAETSLRLFLSAARAFSAKYGEYGDG